MTNFRELCVELLDELQYQTDWSIAEELKERAHAALTETEPQRRCIYSPVQIAECGGPCEQGPEYCDCGELWVTELKSKKPTK